MNLNYCLTDLGMERFFAQKPEAIVNQEENMTQEQLLQTRSQLEEQARVDFSEDNFHQRRASQAGAGVAYDPESLLTGEEIAAGLDYDCPRDWSTPECPGLGEHRQALAIAGGIPTEDILRLAPRKRALGHNTFGKGI